MESGDSRREKVALQDLSRLYRGGHRLGSEAQHRLELLIVGLTGTSPDPKVVRWGLNATARMGTKASINSTEHAIRRYEAVPEIVAAGVSALANLYTSRIADIPALRGIAPEIRMLAAMQTVDPKRLAVSGLQIDIDSADTEILKLALIVVGLDRDTQHLLHPRHENGVIVRELSRHDDPIVRQYAVWAVIENHRLSLDHLGLDLSQIEEQPPNVQAKLLELGASSLTDPRQRQELILRGADLSSIEAREGLAKGVKDIVYDGLDTATLPWFETEESERVKLLLAEHFARHADDMPSYRDKALEIAEEGGRLRDQVLLGAEGTRLYGEIRSTDTQMPLALFGHADGDRMSELARQVWADARETILVLNANPDDRSPLRVDREAATAERQLEMVKSPKRRFQVVQRFAVGLRDVQKELLNNEPIILQFSGHGTENLLFFETSDGRAEGMEGSALAGILAAYGRLECLVLHACYAKAVAHACAAHVGVVIGSTAPIVDETAPAFTAAFYQGLAHGRSYRNAYDMGVADVRSIDADAASRYAFFGQ